MTLSWHLVGSILGGLVFFGVAGWLAVRVLKRAYDPALLLFKWFLTALTVAGVCYAVRAWGQDKRALLLIIVALVAGAIVCLLWAPHIGAVVAKPLTSLFDGGDEEPEPQPLYSIALAHRKKGRPHEAVFELRRQLEKFPNDLTAQLLTAQILVEDLNDLPGAQLTIERLVAQPGHTPSAIADALHQLAGWQLTYAQDIEAARASLQQIITRFPGTPMAAAAAERIAHLGGAQRLLRASTEPTPVTLRPGVPNIGLLKESASLRPPEPDPAKLAQEYVRQLEQHPLDSEAREKLAVIYAEHYRRLDLAADQLEQLIQLPGALPRHVARWLNLLADLHVRCARDYEAARRALERIIELFPDSPYAQPAEQRLDRLNLEIKGQQAPPPAVKLGTYQANLGLKTGPPAHWPKPHDPGPKAAPPEPPPIKPPKIKR